MTPAMVASSIQRIPSGVRCSGPHSSVKRGSAFRRRDAIRMKMRNAVSLKPKPGRSGSA